MTGVPATRLPARQRNANLNRLLIVNRDSRGRIFVGLSLETATGWVKGLRQQGAEPVLIYEPLPYQHLKNRCVATGRQALFVQKIVLRERTVRRGRVSAYLRKPIFARIRPIGAPQVNHGASLGPAREGPQVLIEQPENLIELVESNATAHPSPLHVGAYSTPGSSSRSNPAWSFSRFCLPTTGLNLPV